MNKDLSDLVFALVMLIALPLFWWGIVLAWNGIWFGLVISLVIILGLWKWEAID